VAGREAVAAIDGLVTARLERHFGHASALTARRREHFTSAAAGTAAAAAAAATGTSGLTGGTAIRATARLIGKALHREKLLLT
jgi:hypothetical protein